MFIRNQFKIFLSVYVLRYSYLCMDISADLFDKRDSIVKKYSSICLGIVPNKPWAFYLAIVIRHEPQPHLYRGQAEPVLLQAAGESQEFQTPIISNCLGF